MSAGGEDSNSTFDTTKTGLITREKNNRIDSQIKMPSLWKCEMDVLFKNGMVVLPIRQNDEWH